MDLYILDDQFRRTAVVDLYESLIWTERFSAKGDFQLVIHADRNSRTLFVPGTNLSILASKRVMTVKTVVDRQDTEGRIFLEVKGPSLESIFEERIARDVTVDPDSTKWEFTGLPAAFARLVFEQICVDLTIDAGDGIPFYTPGNLYPTDTIPEPDVVLPMSLEISTMYDAFVLFGDLFDLGFRLTKNGDESELMFNIYSGNDHTTLQDDLPAVIFAPELDNLQDIAFLVSVDDEKNVAYVVSPYMTAFVYTEGTPLDVSGLDRKVLHVNASDITYPADREGLITAVTSAEQASIRVAQGLSTTTEFQSDSLGKLLRYQRLFNQDEVNINTVTGLVGTTLTAPQIADINAVKAISLAYNDDEDDDLLSELEQRGRRELASHTTLAAFDGEVPYNSQYIYGRDYELGDLVEIRNANKATNQMRVTEQIFVSDNQGDRSYPTLAIKQLITPGSWAAEPPTEVWADLTDPDDTWGSRP